MNSTKIDVIDNSKWLSFEITFPNGNKMVTGVTRFLEIYEVGMEITLNGVLLDSIKTHDYVTLIKKYYEKISKY